MTLPDFQTSRLPDSQTPRLPDSQTQAGRQTINNGWCPLNPDANDCTPVNCPKIVRVNGAEAIVTSTRIALDEEHTSVIYLSYPLQERDVCSLVYSCRPFCTLVRNKCNNISILEWIPTRAVLPNAKHPNTTASPGHKVSHMEYPTTRCSLVNAEQTVATTEQANKNNWPTCCIEHASMQTVPTAVSNRTKKVLTRSIISDDVVLTSIFLCRPLLDADASITALVVV